MRGLGSGRTGGIPCTHASSPRSRHALTLCFSFVLLGLVAVGAPSPGAAQSRDGDRPDFSARAAVVADDWAEQLRRSLRSSYRRLEPGTSLALRPLDPQEFSMLNGRQRRHVYEWLLDSLDRTLLDSYNLVDPARLVAISRAFEDTGDSAWMERYLEVLKNAEARISIVCTGISGENAIRLKCSANDTLRDGVSLGRASASFQLEWLNEPIALDLAIGSIAGVIVGRMKDPGIFGRPRVVDRRTEGESLFARHVAGALEVAIDEKMKESRAWRSVGAGDVEAEYRLEGEVRELDKWKLELRVAVFLDDRRLHSALEAVSCSSVPEKYPCGEDPDPTRIILPEGISLADWALVAAKRLEASEHERLLVESNAHQRTYGRFPTVTAVRERAIAGLVARIRITRKEDALQGLERIARVEASAGKRPELLRLRAKAHRMLGNYREEEAAFVEWLRVAPQDHPERLDLLLTLQELRRALRQHEKFSQFLGRGFSPDIVDEETGWTDLHFAALLNLPNVITALAKTGMAADTRLREGAHFGDDLKRTLGGLGHGGEFDYWNADGETPLMIAAVANAREASERLLDHGADLRARNARGSMPLHLAALRDADKVAGLLLERGADVHERVEDGFTPLHLAASRDAHTVAKVLLDHGADVHARSVHGKTPLHRAAWHDAIGLARLLLARGADIDGKEKDGDAPLHNAASADAREVAKALLDHGADVHAKTVHGKTPLHRAAWRNAGGTARLLMEAGADVKAKAIDGSTPLHFAALGNAPGIAKLLLDRGAEIGAKDKLGRTPLQAAAKAESHEVEALLVRRMDAAAFSRATRLDTAAGYDRYLGSYPEGLHADEAHNLRAAARVREADHAAFARAKREGTAAGYDRYLNSHPEGLHAEEARGLHAAAQAREEDAAAFAHARRLDTVSGYDAYLGSYPEGLHADEAGRLRTAAKRREAAAAAFALAKRLDTVAGYNRYLGSYSKGRHAGEARGLRAAAKRREADDAAFARARGLDTVAGYDRYLTSHSRGRHVAEARGLRAAALPREERAAFVRAQQADTVAGYDDYLRSYPGGLHAAEAHVLRKAAAVRAADAAAFARAKGLHTVAGYDAYLGSYPEGLHSEEARRLHEAAKVREADAAAFAHAKRLDTVAGYDEYLVTYPGGRHLAEARRLRAAVVARETDDAAFALAKRLDTVAAYDQYVGTYPEGLHADEARRHRAVALRKADNAAFAHAMRLDTVAGYDAYLGSHPGGRHVAEARRLRDAASKVRQIAQVFRDCDHCPELVVVPPGTYLMGSPASEEGRDEDEGPRHRVVVANAFAVGTAEVTRGEYARFVRDTGHSGDDSCRTFEGEKWKKRSGRDWRDPGYHQTDRHPAVCVNWDDAQRYVAWLSRETGEAYRLPSESEWEYVARGGTDTSRHWGDGSRFQCRYANGADEALKGRYRDRREEIGSCGDRHVHTAPAKRYAKNGYGLFDVLGNVWEWTADCGNDRYDEAPGDGSDWARGKCSLRILRGGSWYSEPNSLRSANRLLNKAGLRNGNVGFRVVRELRSAQQPGLDIGAAIAGAEDETFTRATTRNTVESYDEYLNLYPEGRHAERARRLRDRAFRHLPPGGAFSDCADCPEMAVVPMGSFEMGSPADEAGRYADEDPVRRVTLGGSFAVGVHEVTRREYAAFVRESGHAAGDSCWVYEEGKWKERTDRGWRKPGYGQTGDHPAVCVSWADAAAYAEWLSRKTGARYRLPSESEWEYAARGGTRASRHWGDDGSKQCRYANGADQTAKGREAGLTTVAPCRDGYFVTAPAGRFEPNGYGLHDVLGNAWEWTRDCWNFGHGGARGDGSAREAGDCTRRVLRGGSWSSFPRFLRSARRHKNAADIRVNDVGFRVARALPWAADDAAFWRAKNEDTVESYEKYVESYPEGRHVAEAKRFLAGPKDGETFRDCAQCPELVVVPAGTFVMGSPPEEKDRDRDEGPEHRVSIEKRFAMGVHEVTFEEWDACVDQGGCNAYRPQDRGWGRGRHPVIFVSWNDARSYVEWLSRKTGEDYRLPSESEWEYVARAGRRTRYAWGDEVGRGKANCEVCGSRWDDKRVAPVGSFPPNAFGVHDVHGNASEWVEDCWTSGYSGAPADGTALDRANCLKRVLRGGAWNDQPRYLRSANRSRSDPGKRAPGFGFRVARSLR